MKQHYRFWDRLHAAWEIHVPCRLYRWRLQAQASDACITIAVTGRRPYQDFTVQVQGTSGAPRPAKTMPSCCIMHGSRGLPVVASHMRVELRACDCCCRLFEGCVICRRSRRYAPVQAVSCCHAWATAQPAHAAICGVPRPCLPRPHHLGGLPVCWRLCSLRGCNPERCFL